MLPHLPFCSITTPRPLLLQLRPVNLTRKGHKSHNNVATPSILCSRKKKTLVRILTVSGEETFNATWNVSLGWVWTTQTPISHPFHTLPQSFLASNTSDLVYIFLLIHKVYSTILKSHGTSQQFVLSVLETFGTINHSNHLPYKDRQKMLILMANDQIYLTDGCTLH